MLDVIHVFAYIFVYMYISTYILIYILVCEYTIIYTCSNHLVFVFRRNSIKFLTVFHVVKVTEEGENASSEEC